MYTRMTNEDLENAREAVLNVIVETSERGESIQSLLDALNNIEAEIRQREAR